MNYQYKKSGFTLLEIVIVVAIIGGLAALGGAQLRQFLPGMHLKAAARELYSNMQKVRMSAIKDNKNWVIVFDTANNRYLVCSDNGADGVWSNTADNTIELIVNLLSYKSGVKYGHGNIPAGNSVPGGAFPVDEVSYGSNVLSFNSRGTGSAGYVYLDNENNTTSYAVGTQSSGVVLLLMWQGNKWD